MAWSVRPAGPVVRIRVAAMYRSLRSTAGSAMPNVSMLAAGIGVVKVSATGVEGCFMAGSNAR
jgi:hypothetical protein